LSGLRRGGVVHVEKAAMLGVVSAAGLLVACGQQGSDSPVETAAVAASRTAAAAVASFVAPPPNAQGDPACPQSTAWGRDPRGAGVLVTHWSDAAATVTVLVRTVTGSDRAQRDMLGPEELRLFEFPDIDDAAVRDVLLMTDTRRCFVLADPATFG